MKESCGYYSEADLMHFCIVTEQNIVDILAMCEPEFIVRML
jgi:hypothetical protein